MQQTKVTNFFASSKSILRRSNDLWKKTQKPTATEMAVLISGADRSDGVDQPQHPATPRQKEQASHQQKRTREDGSEGCSSSVQKRPHPSETDNTPQPTDTPQARGKYVKFRIGDKWLRAMTPEYTEAVIYDAVQTGVGISRTGAERPVMRVETMIMNPVIRGMTLDVLKVVADRINVPWQRLHINIETRITTGAMMNPATLTDVRMAGGNRLVAVCSCHTDAGDNGQTRAIINLGMGVTTLRQAGTVDHLLNGDVALAVDGYWQTHKHQIYREAGPDSPTNVRMIHTYRPMRDDETGPPMIRSTWESKSGKGYEFFEFPMTETDTETWMQHIESHPRVEPEIFFAQIHHAFNSVKRPMRGHALSYDDCVRGALTLYRPEQMQQAAELEAGGTHTTTGMRVTCGKPSAQAAIKGGTDARETTKERNGYAPGQTKWSVGGGTDAREATKERNGYAPGQTRWNVAGGTDAREATKERNGYAPGQTRWNVAGVASVQARPGGKTSAYSGVRAAGAYGYQLSVWVPESSLPRVKELYPQHAAKTQAFTFRGKNYPTEEECARAVDALRVSLGMDRVNFS